MIPKETKIKVSSTLNKDSKNWGKQHLIDGNVDTCWNSDQGQTQWISLEFPEPVIVKKIFLTFQGGFVGKECLVVGIDENFTENQVAHFWPRDDNSKQEFETLKRCKVSKIKLKFSDFSDFYGRITLYDLDLEY